METGKIFWTVFLIVVVLLLLLTSASIAETNRDLSMESTDVCTEEKAVEDQSLELRAELINATLSAISMEIGRYQRREDEQKEEKISYLEKMLDIFQSMKPEEYVLEGQERKLELFNEEFGVLMPPELREVEIVAPPREAGSILEVVGMTRSGPFYHVAGVRGNNFDEFKNETRYRLKTYLVYKREYLWNMPDYYVYVAEWQPIEEESSACLE